MVLGCGPAIVGAFDFGFMALAAPAVSGDVGAGHVYPWLFSAASIAYGAAVMPAGALSERFGPRTVIAAGFFIASAGAALVASSDRVETILFGRAMFGLGSGATATPALALLAGIAAAEMRRHAFAVMGAGIALGFTAGVVADSLVVPALGWRPVFAVVVVLLGALGGLAAGVSPTERTGTTRSATGPALLAAATVAAAGCLVSLRADTRLAILLLLIAVALATVGLRDADEQFAGRRRRLSAICVAGAAVTASGVGATVLLGRLTSSSAWASDLLLCSFGVAALPAIRVARTAAARAGAPSSATLGLIMQGSALAALSLLLTGPALAATMIAPIALFGAGHVVANAGVAAALVGDSPSDATPLGGLLVTSQYLGAGVGPHMTLAAVGAFGNAGGMIIAAGVAAAGAALLASSGAAGPPASRG
jgi:MFS family permease